MVVCPRVYSYVYTVRGCFYTERAFQTLNKVTWATETSRSWLLQHALVPLIVCGQKMKQFLLILLLLNHVRRHCLQVYMRLSPVSAFRTQV